MRIKIMSFFAISFIATGCITVESSFEGRGLNQATSDLDCAKEKIQYKILNRNDGLGCNLSQVEATGCGKKALYNCDAQQQWVRSGQVKSFPTAKVKSSASARR
jgi:hypothetical protein